MTDSFFIFSGQDGLDIRRRNQDVQRVSRLAREMLAEITNLNCTQRHGRLHRRIVRYLNCEPAKLWAAQRALPSSASDAQIRSLSARINPFSEESLPIIWRAIPKRSGLGFRVVCELPPRLKGAHYLIKDVLQAQFEPLQHLFDVSGRGRDKAAEAVKDALEDGYNKCFIGDVRDCYQHVSGSTLRHYLPLPKTVVDHKLDCRFLMFARRSRHGLCYDWHNLEDAGWNGPRGLLQGSPASSIILAILFNSMAAHVAPHDCVLITSSDNIFVAAKSDAVLQEIIALIHGYLHEHPAGPFDLNHSSGVVHPGEDFEFLGYRFVSTPVGIVIEPSLQGELNMSEDIEAAMAADIHRGDQSAAAATDKVRDYFSGYKSITNWEEQRIERTCEVRAAVAAEIDGAVEEVA